MAFSVSPSVIVREVDASATVPAIATPPAAIAGIFRWGPVNDPVLITSETQLVNRFGQPTDDNFETFFTAADYLAYSNALYVVRADDGSVVANGSTLVYDGNNDIIVDQSTFGAFQAKYQGELGNSLEVAYCSSTGYENEIFAVGGIPAQDNGNVDQAFTFNSSSLAFQVANTDQITSLEAGDILRVGNDSVGYQEISVASITETANTVTYGSGNTAVTVTDAYDYTIALGAKFTLSETSPNLMSFTKRWAYANLFPGAPSAAHIHAVVIDEDGAATGDANTLLETYENLSTTAGSVRADGSNKYYETVIENASQWIKVANTAVIGSASTAMSAYESMTGGTDAKNENTATLGQLGFAWDELKNSNELDINFILLGKGDDAGNRANYIISNVADYRKDCVAYISPSKEAVVDATATATKMTNAIAHRNKIQSSSYAFMDSGYKYRYDKYNDKYRWTPLNGDMAGLASRVEVWESPAGFRKGIIKNVVKLAFNPNKAQRDQLYSSDINPVMAQVGQGIMLFGDKTLFGQTQSAFDRLNVRRLFIAVEKSIATAAQGFLFELNDEFTQTQFKNIVDPFLRDIQGRRGIIDFRVVSDATVNTPAVIDQNKFRANIFIQPARSINVIELTFVATRTGIEFDEIVGSLS
jgi:phage tail sheath protein FI